jgi:hypothetical protein
MVRKEDSNPEDGRQMQSTSPVKRLQIDEGESGLKRILSGTDDLNMCPL